jgi:hypothetical protein
MSPLLALGGHPLVAARMSANDPKRTFCPLFNHLVGAAEQRERNGDAKLPRGPKVDYKLDRD